MHDEDNDEQQRTIWGASSRCRSCGAEVYWLRHLVTQKMAPIDVACNPDGNVVVNVERGTYVVLGTPEERKPFSHWLHTSHFQTCPSRDEWRKRGSIRDATKRIEKGQQP